MSTAHVHLNEMYDACPLQFFSRTDIQEISLLVQCKQVVSEKSLDAEDSKVATQLIKTIQIAELPEGIISFINTFLKKQKNEEDLKEIIRNYFSLLEVITVSELKSQIIVKESGKCIGTIRKNFCYVPGELKSVLYLDSHPADDDDAYVEVADHLGGVLCQRIKDNVLPYQEKEICKFIKTCLKAIDGDKLKKALAKVGVHLDGSFMQKFSKKLGEEIPRCWYHRLDQDPYNVFNPMEYVGYEDREGHIIVAQIVHPVKAKENEQELEKKYKIYVTETDQNGCDVSILSLYKFLPGSKKPKLKPTPTEDERLAVAVFDEDDLNVKYRASLITEDLIEIKRRICKQLREIWKLSPDLKRRAMKRLFLRWHPDKNPHNQQEAEKIFKYLMKQIEHLEKGEPLDDPEVDQTEPKQSSRRSNRSGYYWRPSSSYSSDFYRWTKQAGQDNAYFETEKNYFQSRGSSYGGTSYTSSSFPFEEQKDERNPEEGDRWVKQAEAEFKVLSVVHSHIEECAGYSYVCFMAHQVVEKALKGGVYALCGLDGRGLTDHNLSRHAYALEAKKPDQTCGLAMHAIPLENYYLDTRYPNRWQGYNDTPAEHFTPEEADQAKDHAKAVLAIVRSIMPTTNEY